MYIICTYILTILITLNVNNIKAQTYQDSIKKLKVVIVVGSPLMTYKINKEHQENVDYIYNDMKKRGLKVFKSTDAFYTPKTCKDANIIIYIGHGGINKDSSTVGFYGMENNCVPDFIIRNLQVRQNSLVIYHTACTGAGTSASDTYDIGFDEAKRRVKINGDLYFATNTLGGIQTFMNNLLNKKMSIEEISNEEINTKKLTYKSYEIPNDFIIKSVRYYVPEYVVKYTYSYAYYANPTYSVKDLLNY